VHGKSGWKRQASVSFVDESRDEEFLSLVKPLCAVINLCPGARIAGSEGRKEGKDRRETRACCSLKKKKKTTKKKKESSRERERRHSSHSIAPLSMTTDGPTAIYRFSQQCRDDKTNQLIAIASQQRTLCISGVGAWGFLFSTIVFLVIPVSDLRLVVLISLHLFLVGTTHKQSSRERAAAGT